MTQRFTFIASLIGCLLAQPSWAGTDCPEPHEIQPQMLVGGWSVLLSGLPGRPTEAWSLVLKPHPEYEGSLKGTLTRGARQHQVAGDWDDATLTLEESEDGQRIAATWQGEAVAGSCGRWIEGLRFTGDAPGPDARRFRMRSDRPR